jgi:Zn finger protein HypA/HybF involved in hydrogenase expression
MRQIGKTNPVLTEGSRFHSLRREEYAGWKMHELAITENVVEALAERVGEPRVRRVVLEIGMLSGVLPDALRFCFDLCTEATVLQEAALESVAQDGSKRAETKVDQLRHRFQ